MKDIDKTFLHNLHHALRHLYEPIELRRNELVNILGINPREDVPTLLRERLLGAIHSMKPDPRVPPESNSWRYYKILCTRFEEQFSQEEVASQLAISPRHIRRLENQAVQALAQLLAQDLLIEKPPKVETEINGNVANSELNWLRNTYQPETTDLKKLIETVLATSKPLLSTLNSSISVVMPSTLPHIIGQQTILRQIILNLIVAAAKACPQSAIQLSTVTNNETVEVVIQAKSSCQEAFNQEQADELIQSAKNLVELTAGKLILESDPESYTYISKLILQSEEKIPILMIDDNEDSLHLFERYLEGTRYQFHYTKDARAVIDQAVQIQARIIVLDIMLPEVDGWELLGRIRSHPDLGTVPVIVSTILPQEQLAYSLGAVGYLQKPVKRSDLLEKLDFCLKEYNSSS